MRMCNIAGYNGPRRAAPILLEMLRREEIYDGGFSTGIATIHDGKIHYRKVIGNVDTLIRETDALDLPGTVGIAHSRPGADRLLHAHPQVSNNGEIALVTNGTGFLDWKALTPAARKLEAAGYTFSTKREGAEGSIEPTVSDGSLVWCLEVCVNLTEYYMEKEGLSFEKAFLRAADEHPGERVQVQINSRDPSSIFVIRNTRPMEVLVADGESYIATTRLAFPCDVSGDVYSLPVLRLSKVGRGRVEFTEHKMKSIKVSEITPKTYLTAYNKIVDMLSSGECVWDDIELAMKNTPELWNENNGVSQYAKVGYDVLWQLKQEGRLSERLAPKAHKLYGERILSHMSLKK